MDVLEDITRELRGSDDRDRSSEHDAGATTDARTDRREIDGGRTRGDRDLGGDDRDETHVCTFCTTEFDASSGTCPDCGAEIVLRGGR